MATNDLPRDLLDQLRPADLCRYALATGWQRNEAVAGALRGECIVFQHPASELDQLVVPAEGADLDAYALLTGEVVRHLAAWEKRPARVVLNDLLQSREVSPPSP